MLYSVWKHQNENSASSLITGVHELERTAGQQMRSVPDGAETERQNLRLPLPVVLPSASVVFNCTDD